MTSTVTRANPHVLAILQGECDDDLDAVYQAYRTRSKAVAAQRAAVVMAEMKVGDKVVFVDTVKPMHLRGEVATIVKINKTRVSVRMDRNEWESFNVPPALLKPLVIA